MRAGDVAAMPADIRHQGYSPKRSMLLVWENASPELPELIATGRRAAVPRRVLSRRTADGRDRRACRAAVADLVHDGDTVALEGFTHLIPHAAGHEIIRQGRRDLHLVRMTPDVVYDQLIGAGCAARLVFSWGGNPGVGSLHRFRDAVEHGWPRPLEIEEHSHAGMAARYVAGASGLPFGVLRGYVGTDLIDAHAHDRPDHMPVHRRGADRRAGARARRRGRSTPSRPTVDGNVQLCGASSACRRRPCSRRSARSSRSRRSSTSSSPARTPWSCRRGWSSAVCLVPGGAHPSFAMGYSERDNDFYRAWDDVVADRDAFDDVDRHARPWHGRLRPSTAAAPASTPRSWPCLMSWTTDDLMIVNAAALGELARRARCCFVGIGLPSTAANLARRLYDPPHCVLVYESGCIGSKPTRLPLSIGDGELAETADAVVSVPEIFAYWLQAGRIDVGFLGAAQLDRFANINSTVIGDYDAPTDPPARRRRRPRDRRLGRARSS